jgi:CheY-like chemotaxis protein
VEVALRESEGRALGLVKELEEADKSKNQFISALSHEFRNPLAVITVGLSVLEVSTDKQQTESVKEIIKRQVDQLCKLVDDLLDLTRITQNKIRLKKESIIFNKIVRDAVEDIRPEFDKKGVHVWDNIQTLPIFLYADPTRMIQCVGNLLHNAVKFTPANGNVWVSLKQENNEAVLCVQDNGIGISQGILEKLFQPFTQADDSLDRYENNGLGLGLSIVKGIVDLHDGTVSATSEGMGKGALFTIRFPISESYTEKQGNMAIKKARRCFTILVIEDNKDLAELLRSMINMLGHEAYTAHNGIEGIAKAREIQPDIIFCDIGLPVKNGFEVAKIIREDAKLKNAFLIALSGYAGEHDIDQAIKSGFDRHLAKPIDMDTLKRMLSEDLDRR